MKFEVLAKTFQQISLTSSRLEKTAILASFLQSIDDASLDAALLLLQGRVFPEWDEQTIGVAGKLVLRGIARASGHDQSEVALLLKEKGDVGEVAETIMQSRRQQTLFSAPLTLQDVFATLQKLATLEGNKSQDVKLAEFSRLLTSASSLEAKFIVRAVLEDLRVGVAEGTLRDAIAYACFTQSFSYNKTTNTLEHVMLSDYVLVNVKEHIKHALDFTADFAVVLRHIRAGKPLDAFKLMLGKPCRVMLARKEKTFAEAFSRTGFPVRIEYKYDGFRLQIHKEGDVVRLFTRRLDEVTKQFPDVVLAIRELVVVKNCILDAEAVGFDPQTGKYQPFQHVSKRIKRKYDIAQLAKELPVEVNVFDVLFVDGVDTIQKPLFERLSLLSLLVSREVARKLVLVKGMLAQSNDGVQAFYEQSLSAGNEGVMIKDINAPYQPGGRVSAWIKMKPIMDELDLVVVEAEWGSGKRSAWMTSFTLACKDDYGELLPVGKVGTGLKELDDGEHVTFAQLTSLLEPLITHTKGPVVTVRPEVILTIAYEEIQQSPSYASGFALRFPRVLALRADRSVDDIADLDDMKDLFSSQ